MQVQDRPRGGWYPMPGAWACMHGHPSTPHPAANAPKGATLQLIGQGGAHMPAYMPVLASNGAAPPGADHPWGNQACCAELASKGVVTAGPAHAAVSSNMLGCMLGVQTGTTAGGLGGACSMFKYAPGTAHAAFGAAPCCVWCAEWSCWCCCHCRWRGWHGGARP